MCPCTTPFNSGETGTGNIIHSWTCDGGPPSWGPSFLRVPIEDIASPHHTNKNHFWHVLIFPHVHELWLEKYNILKYFQEIKIQHDILKSILKVFPGDSFSVSPCVTRSIPSAQWRTTGPSSLLGGSALCGSRLASKIPRISAVEQFDGDFGWGSSMVQ